MKDIEKCIEILSNTNDGDDLSQKELTIVEYGVNDFLSDKGKNKLDQIYQKYVKDD